jgi:hypothetical protein
MDDTHQKETYKFMDVPPFFGSSKLRRRESNLWLVFQPYDIAKEISR